jgi:DNA-binding CsgD family transcriptional regulator
VSELAGRERELAALDAALTVLREGRGGLVVINGEPGIGKSRLALEAIDRAAASGIRTARGYALDDPGAPPLWPWQRVGRDIDGVRQALAGRADIGTDAAARFGLFEATADALASAVDPHGMVVLLEDMQWADQTSVQLLRHISADHPRLRVLLIVTARLPAAGTPWAAALPDLLRSPTATQVPLAGLTPLEISSWLRSRPERAAWAGSADQICAQTSGNPFYLDLLTAAAPVVDGRISLDATVSSRPDLRAIINSQLAELSAPCRDILDVAALLGERISPAVLSASTGVTVAEISAHLAEAAAAGVLRPTDEGPAFTHALVRDSVAGNLGPERRAELHRAIAMVLESDGAQGAEARIAEHWRQAAGPDAAARCMLWARRAAGAAADGFAHDRAVEYAELALHQAQSLRPPVADLAEMTVELAERQAAADRLQEAVGACLQAADLAERAQRPDLLGRSALVITGIGGIDVLRVVNGLCRRALAGLPQDNIVIRARVLAQLAVTESELGAGSEAAELASEALVAAQESGDTRAELEALAALHLTMTVPETVDEREQLAHRAIELGRTAAEPMAALWGHLWLVGVYFQRGELDRIDEEITAIDHIAVQRRFPLARWHIQRIQAAKAALVGEFDAALRYNDDSLELATRMGDISMIGVYHAYIIMLAAARGETSRLGPDLVAMFRSVPPIPLVRTLLVILLLLIGERDEAVDVFDEVRRLVDDYPVGPRWAATMATIGNAAVMLDDAQIAERVYQMLLPTAGYCNGDGSGAVFTSGSNARSVANLALVAGRVDEAVGLYADAVIANSRIGARPFVALSRLGWARAIRRRATDPSLAALRSPGDLKVASDLTRQAAKEFRRLDMPGPLAAADQLLVQLTEDSRYENPLTVRESEIATLVATGMSNKEIAQQLVLSERTVESHVRNILGKLDLSSRADITRWVGRD